MSKKEEKMNLPKITLDDFLSSQEERDDAQLEKVQNIPLNKTIGFKNHPFKVRDDEKMFETVESVKKHGVLVPAIIRPIDKGGYEIVSGHRRKRACQLAGIMEMPCIVRNLTDEEATIIMVDTNLQREDILPSERAFAYKMKLEAIKKQGRRSDLTSSQFATKLDSAEIIGGENGESRYTVYRYIRLTYLIPELLQLVDNHHLKEKDKNKMAMSPAVEISYLTKEEQMELLDTIDCLQVTPSHAQAIRMRKLSEKGELTADEINNILEEEKPNQKEQIRFKVDKVKTYFPKGYSIEQMQDVIEKLLQNYQKQWIKERNAKAYTR